MMCRHLLLFRLSCLNDFLLFFLCIENIHMVSCETLCIEHFSLNKNVFFQSYSCVFLLVIIASPTIDFVCVKCYTSRRLVGKTLSWWRSLQCVEDCEEFKCRIKSSTLIGDECCEQYLRKRTHKSNVLSFGLEVMVGQFSIWVSSWVETHRIHISHAKY